MARSDSGELLALVLANSITDVGQLCIQLGRETDPLERRRVLEFQDTAGFTPLLIAASRGFSQVAHLVSCTGYGIFMLLKSTRAPNVRA